MHHCDYSEHLFVVLVVSHHLGIGVEEWDIFCTGKFFGELVDIHRLVVYAYVLVTESGFWYEINDVSFLVDANHRTVHPCFIFGHESQIGVGMVDKFLKDRIVEYQI